METNWYIGTCSKMFKFFKYINSRNFKSSKFYIIDVVIGGDGCEVMLVARKNYFCKHFTFKKNFKI